MQEENGRGSRFLFNSYQKPFRLVFIGTDRSLLSQEGTTQGDPLSMHFYGLALMPLIRKLREPNKYVQSFYSDDAVVVVRSKILNVGLIT